MAIANLATEEGLPLGTPKLAMWRSEVRSIYHSRAPHGGPSYADGVDLSCGGLEHMPDEDLIAPNRVGADLPFARIYTTAMAVQGIHEPGMTVGWKHTYSIYGSVSEPGKWSAVRFEDPRGAVEEWTPVLKDGKPTGEFELRPGAPFLVCGVPSSTPGYWESLTWQMNGKEKWVFLPLGGPKANDFRLSKIFAFNGTAVTFKYELDRDYRLKEVVDNDGKKMLSFEYGSNGLMRSVSDAFGLSVYYTYSNQAGYPCLSVVSPRSKDGDEKDKMFWKYGYEAIRKMPFLTSVEVPAPSPTLRSIHRNVFDPVTGKQSAFIDANGIRAEFSYEGRRTVTRTISR